MDYEDALRYIEGLSFTEIESNLIIYGKKLVAELPHETTILVKKICTGLATDDAPQKVRKSDPEKFLHIFINCPKLFLEFLEEIVEVTICWTNLFVNPLHHKLLLSQFLHHLCPPRPIIQCPSIIDNFQICLLFSHKQQQIIIT